MNWKPIAIFAAGSIAGFLLQGHGPIGGLLYPPDETLPDPEGANLVLLMLIGGIESLAFGLGITFLAYGMPWVRRITAPGASGPLLYLSVAWLLVNWVPHTGLHMMVGTISKPSEYAGLVAIEYGFHLTLVLAGVCIAYCLMRFSRSGAAHATAATHKARAT